MTNPEFKRFNELQVLITGAKVNTPKEYEDLLNLLDERDVEIRRLAKVFNLEHRLVGKTTWNMEVNNLIKGTNMTKDEAIQLMLKGVKVTHTSFMEDEWISMEGDKILTEEGHKHVTSEFWKYRNHPNFQKGWSIWKEKKSN